MSSSLETDATSVLPKVVAKRRSKVKQVDVNDVPVIDNFTCSNNNEVDSVIKEVVIVKKRSSRAKKNVVEEVSGYKLDDDELIIDKILAIRMKPELLLPPDVTISVAVAESLASSSSTTSTSSVTCADKIEDTGLTADIASSNMSCNGGSSTSQKDVTSDSSSEVNDNTTATLALPTTAVVNTSQPALEVIEMKRKLLSTRELLVKHVGQSYRALKWVDEEDMKASEFSENKLKGFMRVFKRKGEDPYAAQTPEGPSFSLENVVDMDWMEVERIVDIFEEEIGVPGCLNKRLPSHFHTDGTTDKTNNILSSDKNKDGFGDDITEKRKKNTCEIAFVKWRGLGYAECTWEAWEEVQSEVTLINQYKAKEIEVKMIINKNELKVIEVDINAKNRRRVLIAGANGCFTLSREVSN